MNTDLTFRLATKDDIFDIVEMLADDVFGAEREKTGDILSDKYLKAFGKIESDPNQELTLVEMNGEKVGTFQLTFIQYLNFEGGLRAQIEAVRTHSKYRGQGIGRKMFEYAINRAKEKGCYIVQLTSDKRRTEAIKFYNSLGFSFTHEGLKLKI